VRFVVVMALAAASCVSCTRPVATPDDAGPAGPTTPITPITPITPATTTRAVPTTCPEANQAMHELLTGAPSACSADSECMRSPVQGLSCAPFIISRRGWPEYEAHNGADMRAVRAVIDSACGPTKPCPEIPLAPKCVAGRCVNAP
jgi:hypothetical protein